MNIKLFTVIAAVVCGMGFVSCDDDDNINMSDLPTAIQKEFTAKAGGGAVEVTVTGKKEITKIKLSEEVVDPEDIEMLEDLVMAATNEALRMAEEASAEAMNKMTGGLGLGGGFPF